MVGRTADEGSGKNIVEPWVRKGGTEGQERDKTKPRKLVDEAKIGGSSCRHQLKFGYSSPRKSDEAGESLEKPQCFAGKKWKCVCGWPDLVGGLFGGHCPDSPWQVAGDSR